MKRTPLEIRREIIRLHGEGVKQGAISEAVGVNQATVSRVLADAVAAGLILPRVKASRRMPDAAFLALYRNPMIQGTFRRYTKNQDARQEAWAKIGVMEAGQKPGYYIQAGIWAILDFLKKEKRQERNAECMGTLQGDGNSKTLHKSFIKYEE
jgi:hypothetical protein